MGKVKKEVREVLVKLTATFYQKSKGIPQYYARSYRMTGAFSKQGTYHKFPANIYRRLKRSYQIGGWPEVRRLFKQMGGYCFFGNPMPR